MPLYLTGARSSKISKPKRAPSIARSSSSSPFTSVQRTKPTQLHRTKSLADAIDDEDVTINEQLAGPGKLLTVLPNDAAKDVLTALDFVSTSMFESLPDRAGMNSVRIAETLNFRRNLPPAVSLAHVHALFSASSKIEREVQQLLAENRIRKLKLVGRGNDISGLGEVLITTSAYEQQLKSSHLPIDTVNAMLQALKFNPRVTALPSSSLAHAHAKLLTRAGFLVSPSLAQPTRSSAIHEGSAGGRPSIQIGGSGTQDAVGGEALFENLGGVGNARRSQSDSSIMITSTELVLSVPMLGQYVKLLCACREHFLDLLRKSSRHKQAPKYLLKERWDGNVDDDSSVSTAKRVRGEFSNVLPAKTKKWKDLYGINFDWALEECLGAGLVEVFETYSVGLGIRSLV